MVVQVDKEVNNNAFIVAYFLCGQHRRLVARKLALESVHRSDSLRPREIDDQHHCELALFDVALDEWTAHSGGDVPVDRANLVTGLVLAHLGELHSLTLKDRAVLAGKH